MKASALVVLFALPVLAGSSFDPGLRRRIDSFKPQRGTDTLWLLCQTIDRPCGLEEVKLNDQTLSGGSSQKAESVQDALDQIVSKAPMYRWRTGVSINIEPKTLPPDDPLDRKIGRITLKGMSSTRAALSVLHKAKVLGTFQPPGNFRLRRIPDLQLSNVTVREALNRIVEVDAHAMWVVSPAPKPGTVSLFFGLWDGASLKGRDYDDEMRQIREDWKSWNVR